MREALQALLRNRGQRLAPDGQLFSLNNLESPAWYGTLTMVAPGPLAAGAQNGGSTGGTFKKASMKRAQQLLTRAPACGNILFGANEYCDKHKERYLS